MFFFTSLTLFLSLLGLSFAADCTDPRVQVPPSTADLLNFVRPAIAPACAFLTNSTTGGRLSFPLQGYSFKADIPIPIPNSNETRPSGLPVVAGNVTLCIEAYNEIVDQCIVNQTFFGGTFAFQGQVYNLTNRLAPEDPIIAGPGAASTSTTITSVPTTTTTTTTTRSTTSSTTAAVGPVATANHISDTVAAAALAIAALSSAPDAAAAAAALTAVNTALFGERSTH